MFKNIVRDYFSFTKRERTAIIILILLILVISLLPYLFPRPNAIVNEDDLEKLRLQPTVAGLSKKNLNRPPGMDETPIVNYKPRYRYEPDPAHSSTTLAKELFYFDPNTLAAEGWKRLGLRDKTINTIRNYISKGGKFKAREDIAKIYGLAKNDAERLAPYVQIMGINKTYMPEEKKAFPGIARLSENYTPKKFISLTQPVDLNTADSNQLTTLPGIGSRLAARILHFREKLGGFYSVDQLSEIYGLPDSVFQKLKPGLTVCNTCVTIINVNEADINLLKQHPYFKWNVAAAIVEYRRQHGHFESLEDLRKIAVITDEVHQKIIPYLKLD